MVPSNAIDEKFTVYQNCIPIIEKQILENVKFVVLPFEIEMIRSSTNLFLLRVMAMNFKLLNVNQKNNSINIAENVIWTLCQSEQCYESVIAVRRKQNWLCEKCRQSVVHQSPLVHQGENMISKFTRHSYMSSNDLTLKIKSQNKRIKSQKSKICYLEEKMTKLAQNFAQSSLDAVADTSLNVNSIREIFTSASKFASLNQNLVELLKTQVNLERDKKDGVNDGVLSVSVIDKINEVAKFLEEQIHCNAKKFAGKSGSVRYSQSILSLALSVMTRSKSAYEKLRKANIALPCSRQLSHYLKGRKVESGFCISIYENINSAMIDNNSLDRQMILLNDETKIAAGIIYNCKDNSLVGYVDEMLDFNEIHKMFVEDVNKNTISIPAKYCNQWIVRSIYTNIIHVCEYFLSNAPIAGNVLRSQLYQVLLHCEMIAMVFIHAVMADGGGGNSSMNKLVRKSPNSRFMDHPYVTSRKIFLLNCTAHEIKSIRNALLHSGETECNSKESSFTRSFLYKGKPMVWRAVQTLYDLDKVNHHGGLSSTNLTNEIVNKVDGYAAMNVENAKIVFEDKTIAFLLSYAEQILKINVKEVPNVIKDSFLKVNHKSISLTNGDYLWKCRELMIKSSNWPSTLFNPLPTSEFLCVINSLFNSLLLNKNVQIDIDNIANIRGHCDNIFAEFFTPWETESIQRKNVKEPHANKRFLAAVTIEQLKNSIFGFLDFCEYMISIYPGNYLRALLSTSSILENLFSVLKNMSHGLIFNATQYNHCIAVYDSSTAGKELSKTNVGHEIDEQNAMTSRGLETDTKRNATEEKIIKNIHTYYERRAKIIIFNLSNSHEVLDEISHPDLNEADILHDNLFDLEINFLDYNNSAQFYDEFIDEDDDVNEVCTDNQEILESDVVEEEPFLHKYPLGLNDDLSHNNPVISSISATFLEQNRGKSMSDLLLNHCVMLKYAVSLWNNISFGAWFKSIYNIQDELTAAMFELLLWDIVNDMFILEKIYHANKQVAKSTSKLAFERRRRDTAYLEYENSQCIAKKFISFITKSQHTSINHDTLDTATSSDNVHDHPLLGCRMIYSVIFRVLKNIMRKHLELQHFNEK